MFECRFRADRLARIEEIEQKHFWFLGRRKLVFWLLKNHMPPNSSTILDLGCGTGHLLTRITKPGIQFVGFDIRSEGLIRSSEKNSKGLLLAQANVVNVPLRDGTVDCVFMLDVLEHVCDKIALNEVVRILRPGGLLILTVPAFPILWSYRDEDAGHLRRYTRRTLYNTLNGAGLTVKDMLFYQFFLFPLVMISRWLGRRWRTLRDVEEQQLPLLNNLMTMINRMEVGALSYGIRYPWGSTLVAAACKSKI